MIVVGLRVFSFSVLPLLLAAAQIRADRAARSRERKLETVLLHLFALGVAGSGIGGFFGHFILSDEVARSIGWAAGSPFQLEVAFANLALGVLSIGAMGRRDGFREATVVAVTVLGLGATIVHVVDIVASGNLAAGNTLQNVSNVLKPALLIGFLAALRRTERGPERENTTPTYALWRSRTATIAGAASGVVSAGFGAGFALDHPVIGALAGAMLAMGFVTAAARTTRPQNLGAPERTVV
jgi:hypothetical protein